MKNIVKSGSYWEEVDKMEKGKICFYNNGFDYSPTKTYKFNNALLVLFKEIFYAEGETPAVP